MPRKPSDFITVVAVRDGPKKQAADNTGAGGQRVDEVRADESRLGSVPAAHGSWSAHCLERVEEGAAVFRGQTLLHRNESWKYGNRSDAAPHVACTAIHWAHQEDGSLRHGRAHSPDHLLHLVRVRSLYEILVHTFIRSIINDHEVRPMMAQLRGPSCDKRRLIRSSRG